MDVKRDVKKNFLKKIVACVGCRSYPLQQFVDRFECNVCKKHFSIRNNVVYFNIPPKDVPPRGTSKLLSKYWGTWRKSNFEHLEKYLQGTNGSSYILDLGAGRSPYQEYINRVRYPNLISLDFAPFEGINVTADLNAALPFRGETFDVVILSNVLEHVIDPRSTLEESCRVLKQGGIVIGQTPFLMGLHDEPYDFYRYTAYSIKQLLTVANFKGIHVEELSSTEAMLEELTQQFFSFHTRTKWNRFVIRLFRKIILSSLGFVRATFGPIKSKTLPRGYGWVGKK